MLHQFNFDIQYQAHAFAAAGNLVQRRAGPRSFEPVHQRESDSVLAGAGRARTSRRTGRFPYINGTVIPTFSNATQQLQFGQLPRGEALLEGSGASGELHDSEESGSGRRRAGCLHAERRHQHRDGHLQPRARTFGRADRRAADFLGERRVRAAVRTGKPWLAHGGAPANSSAAGR